jgi:hypothetical protein
MYGSVAQTKPILNPHPQQQQVHSSFASQTYRTKSSTEQDLSVSNTIHTSHAC